MVLETRGGYWKKITDVVNGNSIDSDVEHMILYSM